MTPYVEMAGERLPKRPSGTATTAQYLSELLGLYAPSGELRSSADARILDIPRPGVPAVGCHGHRNDGPPLVGAQCYQGFPLSKTEVPQDI